MPTDRAPSAWRGVFVALASLIGVFATTPGQTVGVSAFIDPIASDLGLDRAHVLMLYSLGTFLGILTAPLIGRLVSGHGVAYSYLPASVSTFPPPEVFAGTLRDAGFVDVQAVPLTLGIVYLYTACVPLPLTGVTEVSQGRGSTRGL